jgi:SAM-dependent methyltransferase
MGPAATSAPTAIERALELFETERQPEEARLSDGYLDLLDVGDAAATHFSQRLLETNMMPIVYERFAHPLVMRRIGGRKTPLWSKEQLLALEMLAPSRGECVLDMACGPGNFTRTYAEVAGDALVVGLDLSSSMLAYAARRTASANVAYIRANACGLPFRASSFPAVSCFGAMHLFEDPMRGLAEMVRVLAPGGRVALMTTCETRRLPGMRGWHIFGRDQLTRAFDEHGLSGVEQRLIGGWQCVSANKPQGWSEATPAPVGRST